MIYPQKLWNQKGNPACTLLEKWLMSPATLAGLTSNGPGHPGLPAENLFKVTSLGDNKSPARLSNSVSHQ